MDPNMNPEILSYEHHGTNGFIGELVLNRPKALNAINMNMSQKIEYILLKWLEHDEINAIVMRGAGDRGFCAGGDLKTLLEYIETKREPGGKEDFLRHQYRLIHMLATYPKPLVVMCHGLTFGGGAGTVAHLPHRISGTSCKFAMPETSIGFVPDVGAMHFLSRCPGEVGTFMGLTSYRATPSDLLYCKLIDAVTPFEGFDTIIEDLTKTTFSNNPNEEIKAILNYRHQHPNSKSQLAIWQQQINQAFAYDHVEQIMEHLEKDSSPWAQEQYQILKQRSPYSLKLTLAGLRQSQDKSLAECLNLEYVMAWSCIHHHDLKAGITSAIITKDHLAKWQPKNLSDIDDDVIARILKQSQEDPLKLL